MSAPSPPEPFGVRSVWTSTSLADVSVVVRMRSFCMSCWAIVSSSPARIEKGVNVTEIWLADVPRRSFTWPFTPSTRMFLPAV